MNAAYSKRNGQFEQASNRLYKEKPLAKIITIGGATRLPARKVGYQNELFYPQQIQGLVHGSPSPRSIKPVVTGAVFTTILKQQAKQAQARKALGSPEEKGKGLTKILSLQEKRNVVIKRKGNRLYLTYGGFDASFKAIGTKLELFI